MVLKRPNLFWTQDPQDLGDFLRQVRLSKGIEQLEVAKHLGHTAGFIANVEAGKRLPSTPGLLKWAKFLGLHFMLGEIEQ